LHPDVFDCVPNLIGETEFLRYCINQDKRARGVGGIDVDIFDAEDALPKRLASFQIFHAIKLEGIGYFIENALGNFQSFSGQLVNFVFGLEETGERDENRDDGWSENVWAEVSGGFVAPENRKQNNKSAKAKAAEKEDAGIFHLRRSTTPDRFFRHGETCSRGAREHKPVMRQAFVLAAGLGTRLRPLTDELPKPLVPIFQKRLITFALDHLIAAGIQRFVINTHRLPHLFERQFAQKSYCGRPVDLVNEPELLETGGGIKNAESLLRGGDFLTYSGDILTDIPVDSLIGEHFRAGNDVTLALRETGFRPSIAYRDGRVVDIGGRFGLAGDYDFANIAVWSKKIFRRIPQRKISFIPVLLDWIKEGGKIGGLVLNEGKWLNIGSSVQYVEAHRMISSEHWSPDFINDAGWAARIAKSATIDPTAQLRGLTVVGADCHVGTGAILEDTIVWPGAQIASRSELHSCIVRTRHRAEGILQNAIV